MEDGEERECVLVTPVRRSARLYQSSATPRTVPLSPTTLNKSEVVFQPNENIFGQLRKKEKKSKKE